MTLQEVLIYLPDCCRVIIWSLTDDEYITKYIFPDELPDELVGREVHKILPCYFYKSSNVIINGICVEVL